MTERATTHTATGGGELDTTFAAVLPIKADLRRWIGKEAGDTVTVHLNARGSR